MLRIGQRNLTLRERGPSAYHGRTAIGTDKHCRIETVLRYTPQGRA